MAKFQVHNWQRHPQNPVFPNGPEPFDVSACMNPFVLKRGDEYWMFYAGGDKDGHRTICLAIAPINDVTKWKRLGTVIDHGKPGTFNAKWSVLPCVHRIGNKWHMYFTGNSGGPGGLQAFWGMGLATSDDLLNWTQYSDEPVLRGDGFPEWPDNKGIAGGARILDLKEPNGDPLYRMHYTLATGKPDESLLVNQAKQAVIAHSHDGITWFDKQVVLRPRLEANYEDAATIALNVWKTAKGYRAIYAGIGHRFGAYSICEASSEDGLKWERGEPDENLAMTPQGAGWEKQMVEYPNIIEENGKLRLFYCGNGYGATGIGTALADPLPGEELA